MSVPEVSVSELKDLLAEGAFLIDVREPDEWAEARVPGAVHVPLGEVPDRIGEFKGDPTYVICARGGRSARAAELAIGQGVNAVNVAGGTLGWIEAGFPVDAG